MNGKTFLSVDVDFWDQAADMSFIQDLSVYLEGLVIVAKSRRIPITAVGHHHDMLKAVNKSEARRLLNIDAHCDLASSDIKMFNCGTWVSYVDWRGEGEYRWLHGNPAHCGDCNGGDELIFKGERKSNPKLTDWKKISHLKVKTLLTPLTLKNLTEICVCLSPEFCSGESFYKFHAWRKRHGVAYKRCRKNGDIERFPIAAKKAS